MANLGTLWFGADIDLTKLQQKINQGNQGILNALKMDYDPQSYSQMVSKLRSALDKETFEIKVGARTQNIIQNVRTAVGSSTGIGSGIDEINKRILTYSKEMNRLQEKITQLQASYSKNVRGTFEQQQTAVGQKDMLVSLRTALAETKRQLADLNAQRNALRHSTQDTLLNLRREAAEQRNAAQVARKAAAEKRAAIREYNQDHIRLNTTLANGIHISTELGSAMSSLFAVHQARQFLSNVIEIGGQLEKQRISIGAILGDTVKATHLFEQIKGLALQSPFGVVELDQYTKQLSAYGFKYNELFDMTKRLADISAGAGTDIGRLTLALGHVRSATYLTGITLKQFSMNNIPMLKMLADYYTEVEKKAVSTADVQKRISKRQVSYEDVIEQIRRLTDEGGMFFNMQEKISESLSAKFKNLKDAMDIMYGEMAEGGLGDMLKSIASGLLGMTRHWKEIASVMATAAGLFMLNKLRIGAMSIAMQSNTAATMRKIMVDKQLTANALKAASVYRTLTAEEKIQIASKNSITTAELRQALAMGQLTKEELLRLVALKKINIAQAGHLVGINGITMAELRAAAAAGKWKTALAGVQMSLKNAFMGIGPGTWATLGAMVGMELYMSYSQWASKIEEKSNEMKDLIKSRVVDLQKMQKTLDTDGKPTDKTALQGRVDDMKQVLANSEAYTKTIDEQIGKAKTLSDKYDILSKAIGDAAEKNRQMLNYQDSIAEMIKASTGDFFGNSWSEQIGWFTNDDINKNMGQTLSSYKDLRNVIEGAWEYKEALKGVIEEMLNSKDVSELLKDELKNAPFEEQLRILAESNYWDMIVQRISATQPEFSNFASRIKESSNGVTERWDEIANDDIPRMMKNLAKERGISEKDLNKWCLENIDDFKMMLDGINDQLGIKEPAIRARLKRLFYDYVRFGELANSAAAVGTRVLGDAFGKTDLDKILGEDEKADLHDSSAGGSNDKDKGSKGNKKDAQLEAAKTKLSEYKAFLSEYKKYREMYSKEKSIELLEQLFPNLKGQGVSIVDDYVSVLNKLRDSLPATTEARKKYINELDKTAADTRFDRENESMKKNVEAMDDYIKRMSDKWKLYYSLLNKSGGNEEFARLAFTENGEIWDKTAKDMLATFNQKAKELGVVHVGFRWDMNEEEMREALVDADGKVRDELVKLAQEIQKVIGGNYNKFLEESADAYNKSLTAAQKLADMERKREELIRAKAADNDKSPTKQRGWDAQIALSDKQIAEQRWTVFKETEQWGKVFSDLDNISTKTLEDMQNRLRELAPSVNDDVDAVKALYEAIDKIDEKLHERNPFAALSGALGRQSAIRELMHNGISDLGFRNERGNYTISNANAKKLGLAINKSGEYSDMDLGDGLKGAEKDFAASIKGIGDKFKAVQDVLQPVITLFDTLGNEDLSNFFSMGSNAFGAAAQTAQGLGNLGLGNLGPYGAAAAAALSVVSSIAAMHDKSLQKEIEASESRKKEMENLTKNLETALERSLQGAYGTKATGEMLKLLRKELTGSFLGYTFEKGYISKETKSAVAEAEKTGKYYDAAYASMLAQRDEVQHQMDLERSKKDSDSDKIADYKQELIELDDQVKNFALDMAKSLYDIDVKSWAQELGDALFDAWQKGEDGADAFRKKAGEMIAEVVKSIYAQNLIGAAMSNVENYITKQMQLSKGELDAETFASGLASELDTSLSNIQRVYTSGLDAVESEINKYGMTMKGESESSSSTTSSIKSISEQTADLLASYINAIRADVSVMRENETYELPAINVTVQRMSVLSEAQVQLQTQIAENTNRNAAAAEAIERALSLAARDRTFGFFVK